MDRDKRLRCSFCGKDKDHVKKFICGPSVFICDICVIESARILQEDEPKRSLQEDSQILGRLIQRGLESNLAKESQGGYITKGHDGSYTSCALSFALIGYHGSISQALQDIRTHSPSKSEITTGIALALKVDEGLAKSVVRMHLVENLSALEIALRLQSA